MNTSMALLIYSRHKYKVSHLSEVTQRKTSRITFYVYLIYAMWKNILLRIVNFEDIFHFNRHSSVKCATYKNNYKIRSVF